MKGINYINADQLKCWAETAETAHGWKLARPIGMWGIRRRFKMAWLVFTGQCDVLKWHNQ